MNHHAMRANIIDVLITENGDDWKAEQIILFVEKNYGNVHGYWEIKIEWEEAEEEDVVLRVPDILTAHACVDKYTGFYCVTYKWQEFNNPTKPFGA